MGLSELTENSRCDTIKAITTKGETAMTGFSAYFNGTTVYINGAKKYVVGEILEKILDKRYR